MSLGKQILEVVISTMTEAVIGNYLFKKSTGQSLLVLSVHSCQRLMWIDVFFGPSNQSPQRRHCLKVINSEPGGNIIESHLGQQLGKLPVLVNISACGTFGFLSTQSS